MIATKTKQPKETLEAVIVRFVGDSGDGMQLTGTQFSDTSAMFGNDIATITLQKSGLHREAFMVFLASRCILAALK